MKDLKLCTTNDCEEVAIGAIASKNSNTIIIRYCEKHKMHGVASDFLEYISLEKSIILEVMRS
jgi:hypothetical protein